MVATVRLAGSSRRFPHHASADPDHLGALGGAALEERGAVTVHLRETPHPETLAVRMARHSIQLEAPPAQLTPQQLRDAHGAAFDDIAAVAAWSAAAGLDIGAVDATTRRIELGGTLRSLAAAFSVTLEERRTRDWRTGAEMVYHDHRDELRIPAEFDGVITAVLGLSDRPLGRPRLVISPRAADELASFAPEQLADIYDFPRLDGGGAGQHMTVGIAELGGAVNRADLAHVRASMPQLQVVEEGIHGARPRPDPFGADTEVALDWQVIARVLQRCAPLAEVTLVIRYAPNSERGFTDVIASFASDGRDYAAVSTSWGSPEDFWSPAAMDAMDRGFQMGAARGIVHCVAAGDNGSADARHDGRAHADHPASSPHALGCGGTTLRVVGGRVFSEVAWNETRAGQGATGGGVSAHFSTPYYQTAVGVVPLSANDGRPGRGVPDVAGNADPLTGYRFRHQGEDVVVGGTSAVAPLWSALLALCAAQAGHTLGLVHPALYGAADRALRDITEGDNGAYRARPGWDAATGLGSPDGWAISAALSDRVPTVADRHLDSGRADGRRRDRSRRPHDLSTAGRERELD